MFRPRPQFRLGGGGFPRVSGDVPLLDGLDQPTLVIHDSTDADLGLLEATQDVFHLLPDGSRVEVADARFGLGENVEALDAPSVEWAKRWVPVVRSR